MLPITHCPSISSFLLYDSWPTFLSNFLWSYDSFSSLGLQNTLTVLLLIFAQQLRVSTLPQSFVVLWPRILTHLLSLASPQKMNFDLIQTSTIPFKPSIHYNIPSICYRDIIVLHKLTRCHLWSPRPALWALWPALKPPWTATGCLRMRSSSQSNLF